MTDGKGRFWEIPSMIILIIAYVYLFGGLIDRIPERHVDGETRGKLKFIVGLAGMAATQISIDKILNLIS